MHRSLVTTASVVFASGLLAASIAAPALAEAKKGPHLGDWTCVAGEATSTLTLTKGNRYAVDGGDAAKYVFKAGQNKLKFKTGDYSDLYRGSWDRATKTLSLVSLADDSTIGSCTRVEDTTPAPEPAPEPEPETEA